MVFYLFSLTLLPVADKDVAARVEQHVTSRGLRHIIAIDIDPDAEYQAYFQLQNSIVEAYRQLRDAEARGCPGAHHSAHARHWSACGSLS